MDAAATILIAARNAGATIERAVRSAVRQENSTVLLIDDFSTDDTVEKAKAVDRNLRVIRPACHRSLGFTRQAGLDAIQTPFGIWLDADDELLPGRSKCLVDALERDNTDLASDTTELFDGRSALFLRQLPIPAFVKDSQPMARLFERNYLQGVGYLAFRTEFARTIGYDPDFHGAEDVDFLLRSVAAGARFSFVDKPGYRLFAYPESLSRQAKNQQAMVRRCLMKHDYETIRGLFRQAGHSDRVCAWGLASMALFRGETEKTLEFLDEAESFITDSSEVLEPAGPCPMPEGWRLAFFRGSAFLTLESWDEAELWLNRAEAIQATAEGANNLGVAMASNGKLSDARHCFLRSLELFPDYADARANRTSETPSAVTLHPLRREPSRRDY